jgi:hypothetical protein
VRLLVAGEVETMRLVAGHGRGMQCVVEAPRGGRFCGCVGSEVNTMQRRGSHGMGL